MKIDKTQLRNAIPAEQYYLQELGKPQGAVAGKNKYFCPFHEDRKTPNLIADEKGFKCFACGEGGDIFKFHGKRHNLSFPDVLKYFAGRYAQHLLSGNGNGKPSKN